MNYAHNHVTRDIKKKGAGCPGCDQIHFNNEMRALERKRIARQHWPDCALNHGGTECDMGPECGEVCPDGPHCGCELHRGDDNED